MPWLELLFFKLPALSLNLYFENCSSDGLWPRSDYWAKVAQYSSLKIGYSAKGASHFSFSSISIILIPFWAPCFKNVLAKLSKLQLIKPTPVIEILNSVQFGFSIISQKTEYSIIDTYCVHVGQWFHVAMLLSWRLSNVSSFKWILGMFKMLTFLKSFGITFWQTEILFL